MNTAAHPSSPPHDMHPYVHRGSIPNAHETYRTAAPGAAAPQYPQNPHNTHVPQGISPPQGMPLPQQQQINQGYADPYNIPASRPPMDGQMQVVDGLAPLAPGPGPATAVQDPLPRSVIEGGRKYELCVVQQPRRARMCGFGDKDRRPITPPPCVRLIITDITTGKECDCNEIDHGMFVLNVDLWSADGTREVNLVRHSATSPSISATIPVSYAQVHETSTATFPSTLRSSNPGQQFKYEPGQPYPNTPAAYNPYPGPPQVNPYSQAQAPSQTYGGQQYQPGYGPNGAQPAAYPPQNGYQSPAGVTPVYYTTGAGIHAGAQSQPQQGIDYAPASQPLPSHSSLTSYGGRPFTPADVNIHRMPVSSTQPTGMFTRNLIGSLAASAFRLTDPDDRIGIWFVLQDLSVRTEGNFRLRFSFVNVSNPDYVAPPSATSNNSHPSHSSNGNGNSSPVIIGPKGNDVTKIVNTTKAQVLAACFSEVFTVYSAKKFPGVVESTPLSKCFATQGIKIPIRKDGPGKGDGKGREEYDED